MLVASTSEVYGDPLVHPQTEEYWGNVNPVGPRGVYDESKRFMESITMAYHTFHQVETRIIRIFNTYGPRMRLNDGRALPAFIGQALRGEDLTVFGDGSQTRSFCYVDDLVEGIYRLLLSDYVMPVNIGNPSEISLKDFAEEVLKLTGNKVKIIFVIIIQCGEVRRFAKHEIVGAVLCAFVLVGENNKLTRLGLKWYDQPLVARLMRNMPV